MMGRLMKKLLFSGLALVVLAGCSPFVNLADNGRYRVLGIWPLLCHDDGSVILLQKANTSATFQEPIETSGACTPIVDHTWDILNEKNRARDYRWLGK